MIEKNLCNLKINKSYISKINFHSSILRWKKFLNTIESL